MWCLTYLALFLKFIYVFFFTYLYTLPFILILIKHLDKLRHISTHLFTVFEFPHDTVVIPLRHALRIANGALDEGLQASLEQLIDLIVIVIVVSYTKHTLYVVPDRPSEARRIDLAVRAHCVVR